MTINAWTLTCAKARCGKQATHVVVQSNNLSLLFHSGAGVTCAHHARDLEDCGGVALELTEFALAKHAAMKRSA